MVKQSTNKWALERSRESVNVLLKKAGMEPLLVEVLSDLLWVADHQQGELERVYDWTKYIIEQALVDHSCGDGTVQINQSCHEAIKAWYHTEPVETQPAQENSVGRDAPLSDERLAVIRAMIALTDVGDAQLEAITELLAEVERLRTTQTQSYYQMLEQRLAAQGAALRKALEIAQAVAEAGVGDGDEYGSGSWLMFSGYDAETVREKARTLLADEERS